MPKTEPKPEEPAKAERKLREAVTALGMAAYTFRVGGIQKYVLARSMDDAQTIAEVSSLPATGVRVLACSVMPPSGSQIIIQRSPQELSIGAATKDIRQAEIRRGLDYEISSDV